MPVGNVAQLLFCFELPTKHTRLPPLCRFNDQLFAAIIFWHPQEPKVASVHPWQQLQHLGGSQIYQQIPPLSGTIKVRAMVHHSTSTRLLCQYIEEAQRPVVEFSDLDLEISDRGLVSPTESSGTSWVHYTSEQSTIFRPPCTSSVDAPHPHPSIEEIARPP